jgi:hypothetical protein
MKFYKSVYDLLGPPPEGIPEGNETTRHLSVYQRAHQRVQETPEAERTEDGWRILEDMAEKYQEMTNNPHLRARFRRGLD